MIDSYCNNLPKNEKIIKAIALHIYFVENYPCHITSVTHQWCIPHSKIINGKTAKISKDMAFE